MDLWQWHCQNRREKKLLQLVCGNGIAEIKGKKCGNEFVAMALPKWEGGKKLLQLVCGNGIAQIEGKKKKVAIDLWQWHCRNRREKKLLQLVCDNGIAEIEGKKMWQ